MPTQGVSTQPLCAVLGKPPLLVRQPLGPPLHSSAQVVPEGQTPQLRKQVSVSVSAFQQALLPAHWLFESQVVISEGNEIEPPLFTTQA